MANSIRTYFDLSERERAVMPVEELEVFKKLELMSAGIIRVPEPTYEPVPVLDAEKKTFYAVGNLLFPRIEDAASVLAFKPLTESYDYNLGYEYKYAKPLDQQKANPEQKFDEATFTTLKERIQNRSEIEKRNAEKKKEYESAEAAVAKALRPLYDDYAQQTAMLRYYHRISETFSDYVETAQGDKKVAFGFLLKAFAPEEIAKAFEWLERPDYEEASAGVVIDLADHVATNPPPSEGARPAPVGDEYDPFKEE
jgi:hypothetical protein